MKYALRGIIVLLCYIPFACQAQDQPAVADKLANFPSKFFGSVDRQTARLNAAITRQTQLYLAKLAKQEDKIRKKLYKQDSVSAKKLFGNSSLDYTALTQKLQNQSTPLTGNAAARIPGTYMPHLDSLKTSLKFLQQNPSLLSGGASNLAQINASLAQVGRC